MRLYETCFEDLVQILNRYSFRQLEEKNRWKDEGRNQLIFQSDTACELGEGTLPALSTIVYTDDESIVKNDEVLLYGKDIPDLGKESPYARITMVLVEEEKLKNDFYKQLRAIEYTRYRLNPEGYMMRISSMSHKESVRISKQAIAKGISFADIGTMFVNAYHVLPAVKAVKMIFVTAPDFSYKDLEKIMHKSEDITKALDHLVNKVNMDCDSCGLQKICSEVQDLCEKEFPGSTETK